MVAYLLNYLVYDAGDTLIIFPTQKYWLLKKS